MALGLGKKLRRSPLLHGDFATDVVARPYPVEDGELLRRIGQFVNQRLRPQQNFLGLGSRIAAACDHCLTEQHLSSSSAMRVRSGLSGSDCSNSRAFFQVPDGLRIGRALDRPLPGRSQVVDGGSVQPGLRQVMRHQLGLGFDDLGELLLENIGYLAWSSWRLLRSKLS